MSRDESLLNFEGRWVIVSGASSGIGRAVAVELARNEAKVVLLGRDEARLAETRGLLGDAEHRILALDLTDHGALTAEIVKVRKDVGPLYGLCHAAGIVATRPLSNTTVGVIQAQLDINLLAGLELARAICRRDVMAPEGGSLLFLSSVYGRVGVPAQIGYCATKGAVVAAVRAMAIELARRNIRANCLSPGLVLTEMTKKALAVLSEEQIAKIKDAHPLGIGEPEDVARAAAFLLAPSNRWITGVDLAIDGGFTAQ